jgi:hypothetical protein
MGICFAGSCRAVPGESLDAECLSEFIVRGAVLDSRTQASRSMNYRCRVERYPDPCLSHVIPLSLYSG